MALIAVLDTTGRGTWWSWHLASMLARQDFEVTWVEADKAERTGMLLGPLLAWEWQEGKLPGLAHLTPEVAPREVPGQPVGLKLLPGCPPETERPAGLDQALLAWARERPEWVIADLGRRYFAETIRHSDLLIVVIEPEWLQELRDLGEVLRGQLPEQWRYAVIEERDWRTDRSFLRRRIPAAFRSAWEGGSLAVDLEPVEDTEWCVGVAQWVWRQQEDATPVFDLPPGQGEGPFLVAQADSDWRRIAQRVAGALGVAEAVLQLEPTTDHSAPVVRFCVPDGASARIEGDRSFVRETHEGGFLADPEDGWGIAEEQRPLADVLKELDCALILGEPGIGKSHAAAQLSDEPVVLKGQPDFRRELDELIASGAEILVLDEVDEWTGTADQLADPLVRWLNRQPRRPRLRIFGRAGERMEALHAKLAGRYAEGRYRRLTLLPLRPRDVEPLAAGWIKASAAGMLGQIRALHIESLAARPLTLRMLAHLWGSGQELRGDRVQVYRDGLEALVAHDEGDIGQVMKAARPLAWASILGGTARFRFGIPEAEGELNLHEIQRTFKEVSRADLEAALRTPIFARSEATWTFAHRSYAEYLAATFAVAQGRLSRRLMSLIEIEGMVPEQLSGLAGWLAALDADVARGLIAADPGRLLEQRAFVPEEVRLEWLQALVDAVRQGRAHFWGRDIRVLLGPGVDERARDLAQDKNEEIARSAVRLVAWGDSRDATEWLVELAFARDRPSALRSEAVARLAEPPHRAVLPRLRPILEEEPAEYLRSALLHALWPEHLSALECLVQLRATRNGQVGSLSLFSHNHGIEVVDQLRLEEFPDALNWAADNPYFAPFERWPFSAALIQRAWDLALEPVIASSLARLLVAWFGDSDRDLSLHSLPVDWWDPDDRRKLAILGSALDILSPSGGATLWPFPGWARLLPSLSGLLAQAESYASTDPELAGRWLALVGRYWPWSDEQATNIEALAYLNPAIQRGLEVRRSLPIPQEDPAEAEVEGPTQFLGHDRLLNLLELSREDPLHWIDIPDLLHDRRKPGEAELRLSPQTLAEIVVLTARFLAEPPLNEPGWLVEWSFRKAARYAWYYCMPTNLPSDFEALSFWAATFIADGAPETLDGVLRAFVESLGEWREEAVGFALEQAPYEAHHIFPWAQPFWGPAWTARAKAWLEESVAGETDRRRMRDALKSSQRNLFKALLTMPEAYDDFWAWGLTRLHIDWVISGLFERDTVRAWKAVLPPFLMDEEVARAVALAIGNEPRLWTLDPAETAEVYVRLHAILKSPVPSRNGPMRPIDHVMRLKPILVDRLVEEGAVEQVRRLVGDCGVHPSNLVHAERARAKRDWKPVSSVKDTAAFERRLRTSADLLDRVDEAFEDIEKDLNGELAAWDAFFDHAHERQDKRTWPKHETTACTLLADRLRSKLGGLSFKALNVEPQEVGGQDRIDIKLEVPGEEGNPLTLKVEVKWATNTDKEKGVEAAMESQLVDRYLNHPEDLAGLYLVLWPGPLTGMGADVPARWRNDTDRLDKLLQAQAAQLRAQHPHQPLRVRVLRLGARRSSAASK